MNKPQSINDAIQYQKGSVVSKEIINKPSGTITLFAFDKGQGLSEHIAPYDAFILITDGVAEIVISRVSHTVHSGELLLIPEKAPHSLKAVEQFKMILTMMRA
jgi:quercetin dioxygenase-like cupin family protein